MFYFLPNLIRKEGGKKHGRFSLVNSLREPPAGDRIDSVSREMASMMNAKCRITLPPIPPLPTSAVKALAFLTDPLVDNRKLSEILSKTGDSRLNKRLLMLANSCLYAAPCPVNSLTETITRLGRTTIYQLIMAEAVGTLYEVNDRHVRRFWDHAIATGIISHILARRSGLADPANAYLAGVLHDVGKLILYREYPREVLATKRKAAQDGVRFHEREYLYFSGFDHAYVGAEAISLWNCPLNIVSAALSHHNIEMQSVGDPESDELTCIVSLANLIAHNFRLNRPVCSWNQLLDYYPAKVIALNDETMDRIQMALSSVFPHVNQRTIKVPQPQGRPAACVRAV